MFLELLDVPEAERLASLRNACSEDEDLLRDVQSLLSHHVEGTAGLAGAVADETVRLDRDRPLPEAIGSYRVLGVLGSGGMGIVYEAEQSKPKRRVALKVVRGGRLVDQATVRMFQREVETLGRLDHPNIGAIYEAGSTEEGFHFFAMELVRGDTLGRHLRKRGTGDLPGHEIAHRLELFRRICDAVNYAHQRGVIHRDLKPSNIVVTESGKAKILDFGLARITDTDTTDPTIVTEVGTIRGTLPYMSPEQARGEARAVDLRADVYALGVILYEMVSGQRPLNTDTSSLLEAARVICEDAPRPLRQAARGVSGELETIVAKALEKTPDDRYQSAGALSEDIRRVLVNEPILARSPSTAYQLKKLVARHRIPFALGAGVVGAIIGVAVWMSVLYARAEVARQESEAVTAFLTDMLAAGDPRRQGPDVTVRQVLDGTASTIREDFADRPVIESRLQSAVGNVYRELGLYDEARAPLERALEIRRDDGEPDDLAVAASLQDLGALRNREGNYAEARRLHEEALDIREAKQGPDHPDVAGSLLGIALVLRQTGDYAEARALNERAIAIRENAQPEDPKLANALNALAVVHKEMGRYDLAVPLYERALAIWERDLGSESIEVASALANLGEILRLKGDLDEARPLFARSLHIFEKRLGPDHPEVALSLNSNAIMRAEAGDLDGAQRLFERALAINESTLGTDHRALGQSLSNLAIVHAMKGVHDEAIPLLERAVRVYETALGPEHPEVAQQLASLGTLHVEAGDGASAERILSRALSIQEQAEGDAIYLAMTAHQLACVRRDAGMIESARALFERSLEIREARFGPEDPSVAQSLEEYAELLRRTGDRARADSLDARATAIRATH